MTIESSLALVQGFVHAIEVRDRATIERSLAEDAKQVFPMAGGGWTGLAAVFEGKAEVLDYTFGLFDNFSSLVWTHKDWTVSSDGSRVFMQAKSEAVVAYSQKPYRNTYVTRFDVADGKITRVVEYAISALFEATGIVPSETMMRAIGRAQSMSEHASVG
ncbi:Ketosteroid isomerase-related protein [Sphingomonas palmae]|uniref:Ketosteroid isomerase-related protein n=1 Tax=Sphingomonas palmae TaxID=1855283 RepID=A0A1H7SZX5_9SPHN|nr:nuclear transport factor 2 family protein [Sphingomonas palmae]SEL77524.1 Ketosteroid isomerase-related protein [Sphingomonas palmae]